MEALVPYAVWLCIGLVGLSLLALVLFGLRNLTFGKANPLTIVLVSIPILLLAIFGFATGDWWYAGVITVIIMMVVTSFTLLLSGIRGLIGL